VEKWDVDNHTSSRSLTHLTGNLNNKPAARNNHTAQLKTEPAPSRFALKPLALGPIPDLVNRDRVIASGWRCSIDAIPQLNARSVVFDDWVAWLSAGGSLRTGEERVADGQAPNPAPWDIIPVRNLLIRSLLLIFPLSVDVRRVSRISPRSLDLYIDSCTQHHRRAPMPKGF